MRSHKYELGNRRWVLVPGKHPPMLEEFLGSRDFQRFDRAAFQSFQYKKMWATRAFDLRLVDTRDGEFVLLRRPKDDRWVPDRNAVYYFQNDGRLPYESILQIYGTFEYPEWRRIWTDEIVRSVMES